MKERWFNYRPILLIFGFLLLGSIFAFYIKSFLVFVLSIAIVVFALLLLLAILKKKPKYFLVPLLALLVGIGAYELAVFSFYNRVDKAPTEITARIYKIDQPTDGRIKVEADSCTFDGSDAGSNLIIYIYDYDGLFEGVEIGAKLKFSPMKFYHSDLFYFDIPNAKQYANNTKYSVTTNIKSVEFLGVDQTFAEMLKETIKDNLGVGLTNENSELAYSALFGEKEMLSNNIYSAYRLSGVAHLLAVSGLHVGIIVAILSFILKKCKIKGWIRFSVLAVFLVFYLTLCNFTVSAIRASIMTLILLLAQLLHRDYDSFNAISLAGIIVFFMNPLIVYDVGFLMSFSCAFGIALLYKPLRNGLIKAKFPKAIAESLALSLATTITLMFIMAYFFRTFNVISLLANVILIPLFTIGFVAVFICSILSLITPYVMYILYPFNYLFDFIALLSTILGNLPIANFETIGFHYIVIVIYFLLILLLSRLCTAKYQYKIVATLPIIALMFVCLLY